MSRHFLGFSFTLLLGREGKNLYFYHFDYYIFFVSSVYLLFYFSVVVSSKFTLFLVVLHSYWYCCVDVSVSRQMLVTGDNVGQLSLLGLDGQQVCVYPSVK